MLSMAVRRIPQTLCTHGTGSSETGALFPLRPINFVFADMYLHQCIVGRPIMSRLPNHVGKLKIGDILFFMILIVLVIWRVQNFESDKHMTDCPPLLGILQILCTGHTN